MDKKKLAWAFCERLQQTIRESGLNISQFAKACQIDRSAMSQFLEPELVRLPRAEALYRIAQEAGVSIDWLLGLSNTQEGSKQFASTVEVSLESDVGQASILDGWRQEASGAKMRYVPAFLPELLTMEEHAPQWSEREQYAQGQPTGERLIQWLLDNGTNCEICMPRQTLEALAYGHLIWSNTSAIKRKAQLALMQELTERYYPSIRLHIFDASIHYAAPLTVFGVKRAVVYLGERYLVLTSKEHVSQMSQHFDTLIRNTSIHPHEASDYLASLLSDCH